MSGGHTAGPWTVNPFNAQVDSSELDGDGNLIPVCQVLWPTDLRSEEATRAISRLISAAPELLEALTELRANIGAASLSRNLYGKELRVKADAAIAKARGAA